MSENSSSTSPKKKVVSSGSVLEPTGQSALASLLSSSTSSSSANKRSTGGPLIAELDNLNVNDGDKEASSSVASSKIQTVESSPLILPLSQHQTPVAAPPQPPAPPVDEGPSMLELMMEEQRRAAKEKKAEEEKKQAVQAKQSFGGFKKGFFGGGGSGSAKSSSASSSSSSKKADIIDVKAKPVAASSVNTAAKKQEKLVLNEVQQAMAEDNPTLKALKGQEWITPDLTQQFQRNPILAAGFQNPKCLAAIELMQKDPNEAMKRFQNDPDVSRFLQEFGKVMSSHFEALGAQQEKAKQGQQAGSSGSRIEEIGPLQAQALQKQKTANATTEVVPASATKKGNVSKSATNKPLTPQEEEARVQQILNDPELRELLMDPNLQRILMECGDPKKLQQHMKNPEIVGKIKKLQKAGLVQIEL